MAASQLEELRGIVDPVERAAAAVAYISRGEASLRDARRVRDEALAVIVGTPAEIAVRVGLTPSYVRLLRWKTTR